MVAPRRLHILLKREGMVVNHKKLFRLYREEQLTVRGRGGRKRALGPRAPMTLPQGPNQRWSLDFVADQLVDGRRFRVMVVVDDFTRECPALVVDTSLSGIPVGRELDSLIGARGKPLMIVSDNSTELTVRVVRDLLWLRCMAMFRRVLARVCPTEPQLLRRAVGHGRMAQRRAGGGPRSALRTSGRQRRRGRPSLEAGDATGAAPPCQGGAV